jgi:hypothetical protein
MLRSHRRLAAGVVAIAAVAALPLAGNAAPTCTDPATEAACGGRVVAEPLTTVSFVQYDLEAMPALEAIEAVAPEVVEVFTLDELTGNAAHISFGERPIPVVRLTDETRPATGKRKVVFSLSIHGTEPAGREGGIRYIEDVARWWVDDPTHPVFSGDNEFALDDVLANTEVWLGFPNPDGWAKGDLTGGGGTFARGNDNNIDLNRQFPTMGWPHPSQTPLSEPESDGWAEFVESLGPVSTASDIHGELTSANNAFSDLMWPADQWTPKEQAQELQIGLNVVRSIERKFAEHGVVLGEIFEAAGAMKPAVPATGYDVVGYDDAGFLGDYFTQASGAIDIDAENFLSHMAPGNVWVGPLEQAHVAAVRGIIEGVMVESMITDDVEATLDIGRVAYVDDLAHTTAPAKALEDGRTTKAIDATRLRYFADLAAAAGKPVVPIASGDIAHADLAAYDTLVIADKGMPTDSEGRPVDAIAYVGALETFVENGGQLLLTDGAIPMLVQMGFGDEDAIQEALTNAGHIDFGTRDHAWEADIQPTAQQTYYEVPLGFPATSSAPHYGVASAAWEAAGGTTVGTVTGDGEAFTALGELPRGKGKISIFGAILPQPTAEEEPEDGLADYGVTIAGGQVLHSILSYRRPGSGTVEPAPQPPAAPPAPPTPGPLPATGGETGVLPSLVAAATLAAAVWRRRRLRTA